jgi:hypothetical protein
MSDQPEQSQSDPQSDAVYERALSGEPTDEFGHPARVDETIDGRPVNVVEQEARRNLARVQQARGESGEQDEAQPEQPPAEQPAQEQAAEEGGLAPDEAAAYLLGIGPEEPEELSPEEYAELQAQQAERALVSGEAAGAAVESERELKAAVAELTERLPGLDSEAFWAEAQEPFERLIEAYGEDAIFTPDVAPAVLSDLYRQLGGPARFGEIAEASEVEKAYTEALSGGGPRDVFGFPTEQD